MQTAIFIYLIILLPLVIITGKIIHKCNGGELSERNNYDDDEIMWGDGWW